MDSFGIKIPGINYITRRGSYGLICHNSKVCLVQTKKKLTLPGGGNENSESDEDCLQREILEETGFIVEIQKYLGSSVQYLFAEGEGYFEKICNYYICEYKIAIQNPIEPDHLPLWFGKAELLQKLNDIGSAYNWAIEQYLSVS